MKFSELVAKLDGITHHSLNINSLDPELAGVTGIEHANSGTISYIEGKSFAHYLTKTSASALILPRDESLQNQANEREIAWFASPHPRLLFAQVIALFYQPFRLPPGIHPTAVIDPSAELGKNVAIGAHVVIESGVKIGDNVCIHPHVVVYPQAEIGSETVLHSHCVIHERTLIGKNCVIHSGAMIGAEGFGFVPTSHGWFKMEQSGYVVLENGVEIGCNSTVDRPAVGETRIGENTKFDNLVHIGHGCIVGKNCAFAAQVGLAGGVKIGNNVILAGQVGIANQAVLGDGVIASAKAGIHNDVPSGAIMTGVPAIPHKIFLKSAAIYQRLPEIYQAVKKLQRHLKS